MCAAGFLLIRSLFLFEPLGRVWDGWMGSAGRASRKLIRKHARIIHRLRRCLPRRRYNDNEMPAESSGPTELENSGQDSDQALQMSNIHRAGRGQKASGDADYAGPRKLETLVQERCIDSQDALTNVEKTIQKSRSLSQAGEDRLQLDWSIAIRQSGLQPDALDNVQMMLLFMVLPWIGQRLFWAGFLRLSADLYCPPRLWSNTAVWTIFSTLGVFQGASL